VTGQEALRTTLTPGFGQPGTAAPRRRFNTRPYDVSSLGVAISGGASIPGPVLDAVENRFGVRTAAMALLMPVSST
jgi:hypothetical protein